MLPQGLQGRTQLQHGKLWDLLLFFVRALLLAARAGRSRLSPAAAARRVTMDYVVAQNRRLLLVVGRGVMMMAANKPS